jgi:hypothetical protein
MSEKISGIQPESQQTITLTGLERVDITRTKPYQKVRNFFGRIDRTITEHQNNSNKAIQEKIRKEGRRF